MAQQSEQGKRDPKPVKCLSIPQFYHLFGCFHLFLIILPGILFIVSGLLLLITSLFCPNEYFNLIYSRRCFGYIGAALTLTGSTFYVIGRHKRRTDLKTAEYPEDVESLVAEVKKQVYGESGKSSDPQNLIGHEIARLNKLNEDEEREVSCLETILLRKIQVDLYNADDLKARTKYDLLELNNIGGNEYDKYYNAFEEQTKKAEEKNDIGQLRMILKNIREATQYATFLSGRGEAILESVAHWSMYAIPSLLLLGVLPLLYPPFFETEKALSVVNWMFLGAAGAVLYTVNEMKAKDTTIVGEDEGNRVLRMMLLGTMIGVTTAVLLYSALRGGMLSGTILPDMSFEEAGGSIKNIKNNALSIFWGIFSGFSVKLLRRLMGAAESTTSISAIRSSE